MQREAVSVAKAGCFGQNERFLRFLLRSPHAPSSPVAGPRGVWRDGSALSRALDLTLRQWNGGSPRRERSRGILVIFRAAIRSQSVGTVLIAPWPGGKLSHGMPDAAVWILAVGEAPRSPRPQPSEGRCMFWGAVPRAQVGVSSAFLLCSAPGPGARLPRLRGRPIPWPVSCE